MSDSSLLSTLPHPVTEGICFRFSHPSPHHYLFPQASVQTHSSPEDYTYRRGQRQAGACFLSYGQEEEWFPILLKRLYKKKEVIWEMETREFGIQGHSPIHSEFEASMGYLRTCLKKKKGKKE